MLLLLYALNQWPHAYAHSAHLFKCLKTRLGDDCFKVSDVY